MKHIANNIDIFGNGTRLGINIYKREDVLIFTGPKIASSFLNTYYQNVDSKRKSPLYNELVDIHKLSFSLSTIETEDSEIEWKLWETGEKYKNNIDFRTKTAEAFYQFVKNEELNSDVMILIRNPYIRLCSAFIQDYIKPIIGMRLFPIFIESTLNTGDKIDNVKEVYKTVMDVLSKIDNSSIISEKYFENTPKKLQIIKHHMALFLSRLLRNTYTNSETKFHEGHNGIYHTLMLQILYCGSVPKHRKIKIVDIEEDNLEDELNFYEVGFQKTNERTPNSNPFLTNLLLHTIDNHERYNISDIYDNIKYEITQEIFSYNVLKSLKK